MHVPPLVRETPHSGWKAILKAVSEAIGEEISLRTVTRWASQGNPHRLPVERFLNNRKVFLRPSLLDLWVASRPAPTGGRALPPTTSADIRPFKRPKTVTAAESDRA
jgi:hypothetical protein